jgi:multisubunit Na+/H+ antiporter MnhC subunit
VNTKLDSFIACLYYQVVTQVTVGYGDITVSTYIGRAIMVLSIIIGITTTSILLIFFMRLMEQDSNEEESHSCNSLPSQC